MRNRIQQCVGERLAAGQGFGLGTADGRGRCHAVGQSKIGDRAPVGGRLYERCTAERCNLHRGTLAVFDILPAESLEICRENADFGQNLVPSAHCASRAGVERGRRNHTLASSTLQGKFCVQREQHGRRVGAGRAVAQVAADGAGLAGLRAADLIDRLAQIGYKLLNDGVGRDVGKARACANDDRPVGFQPYAGQLGQFVDGHERSPGSLALTHTDEDVGAACDDHTFRVVCQCAQRIVQIFGRVQPFDVKHGLRLLTVRQRGSAR